MNTAQMSWESHGHPYKAAADQSETLVTSIFIDLPMPMANRPINFWRLEI